LTVKSIGQGNSLVSASTKALFAIATLCSNLKYFGRAVIGVGKNLHFSFIHQQNDQKNFGGTQVKQDWQASNKKINI
jgi:hypothetical protein